MSEQGVEVEGMAARHALTWKSAGTEEPGDQNADSRIVEPGCAAMFWLIGPGHPTGWTAELIGYDEGVEVSSAGVDLGRFDNEADAKSAAQRYEERLATLRRQDGEEE